MKKIAATILSTMILALPLSVALTGCTQTPAAPETSEKSVTPSSEAVTQESGNKTDDPPETIAVEELPAKFDLRNVDGKNYVTSVKRQQYGDCWSFALAGSAEIAYLYANDMNVPAGEINDKVNFSEKYNVWYMFHGFTSEDLVPGKVSASQVGEGFDMSECKISPYKIGGPFVQSANLYGSGFGPVDESVKVNGEFPYAYNEDSSVKWELPLNATYRNAPVEALFRDSRILPTPAEIDSEGNYHYNIEGINAIKSELYQGHGVVAALNGSHSGVNKENNAVYYHGTDGPNHAIVVVGYDDNFSKEKFTVTGSNGKVVEGSTPPADGALIIKNSWGLTKKDGSVDDGYMYVSYYDQSLFSAIGYSFDNNKEAKHTTRLYDQYDLLMTQWYGETEYNSETKMANIFTAERDEKLYQIEYRTSRPDIEVAYEVYQNVEKDDPTSGTLLTKGVRTHQYAGSHIIDLEDEYTLKKGDTYSVVITMTLKNAPVYLEVFPYSTEFAENMKVTGIVNKGESFLFTDGKWKDMTDSKDSILDRAFQHCSDSITSRAFPKIELKKDTFTFDNYPIKAILAE